MESITNLIPDLSLGGVSLMVLIGIIVGAVKYTGVIASRYLPLTSIILGSIMGYIAFVADGITLTQGIFGGIVIGAAVSGFYDLGTKTILSQENDR